MDCPKRSVNKSVRGRSFGFSCHSILSSGWRSCLTKECIGRFRLLFIQLDCSVFVTNCPILLRWDDNLCLFAFSSPNFEVVCYNASTCCKSNFVTSLFCGVGWSYKGMHPKNTCCSAFLTVRTLVNRHVNCHTICSDTSAGIPISVKTFCIINWFPSLTFWTRVFSR